MLEALKNGWRQFRSDPPGERFKAAFRRRQRSPRGPAHKLVAIGGGSMLVAAGVFFLPAPGPGSVILVIGAVLIAQESCAAARFFDGAEVRARKLAERLLSRWRR